MEGFIGKCSIDFAQMSNGRISCGGDFTSFPADEIIPDLIFSVVFSSDSFFYLGLGVSTALAVGAIGFGFGVLYSAIIKWFSGRGI